LILARFLLLRIVGRFDMIREHYINETNKKRGRKKKVSYPKDLEHIHQKNGYFDEKIFYSADRVTYTFLNDDDVIVLHYDVNTDHLFLKGHRIKNIHAHPHLHEFLTKFKKCLMDNPKTKKFVTSIDKVITSLIEAH